MYYNIFYDRENFEVHLWDDVDGYHKFKNSSYCYVKSPHKTGMKSIFGDDVEITKTSFVTEDMITFNKDIRTELKILVDKYHKDDNIAKNKILIIDIETDTTNGYSTAENADKAILSIACRDLERKKTVVFFTDPDNRCTLESTEDNLFFKCESEIEMLSRFIELIKKYTILTGWNSEFYDIPYIINRCEKIKKGLSNYLSPVGIINRYELHGEKKIKIAGLNHLDYMALYKKFAINSRRSYSLNNISKVELQDSKREYEGSLADLYNKDLNEFLLYNMQDVVLIDRLEEKLNYMQIAIQLSHKGRIPYEEIFNQSSMIEGVILCYMKNNNLVTPNKIKNEDSVRNEKINLGKIQNWKNVKELIEVEEIEKDREYKISLHEDIEKLEIFNKDTNVTSSLSKEELLDIIEKNPVKISSIGNVYILPADRAKGAYVKPTLTGRYGWIVDLDMTSLYPSLLRTLNISRETKVCKVLEWEKHVRNFTRFKPDPTAPIEELIIELNGVTKTVTMEQLYNMIKTKDFLISCNGVVYKKERGVIPKVVDSWFEERIQFKNLSKENKKAGNKELEKIYDIKQYVTKIALNSVFGVLLLPTFRFYDKDNAEAITITGRYVIQFCFDVINDYLNKKLGTKGKDFICAGDTDSCLITVQDFANDLESTKKVAVEIQDFINKELDVFALTYLNSTEHYFSMKQEYVADYGFFLKKKAYSVHKIDEGGIKVDTIDTIGIGVVRSDFPEYCEKELNEVIKMVIFGKSEKEVLDKIADIKENFSKQDIRFISKPTGVRNIEKYFDEKTLYKKGAPVHVKSAINYNLMLKKLKLTDFHEPIRDGDKIRWIYLRENPQGYASIGYKDSPPKEILEFISEFADFDKMYEGTLHNKFEDFCTALGYESKDS